MGRQLLGLALGVCLAGAATARGEGVAAPAAPTVERLIEQLGSPDFKVRESAGKALAARGADILPALKKAAGHPDPEVRQRLATIIADTERAVMLAPKRVSLHLDGVPLREAVADLARESGYKIEVQNTGGAQPVVHLDADNVPFWEAFDKLCVQGGLVLQQHYDASMGLVLYNQNAVVPFVDYRGPFRLSAAGFHYNRSVNFATLPRTGIANGQRSEQLAFSFNVVAEPKLPLLGLGQPKVTLAVDDLGQSLVPSPLGRGMYESQYGGYYGYRTMVLQTQVQLAGTGGTARTVKVIRGTLPVTILAEQRPEIVVEDVLKVKHKKFEAKDVALDVEEVKEGPGKTVQVVLTARRSGKDNQYDYTWMNSLQQRVELTDEKGNKYQSHGFNWNNGTPTSVQGTFMFGDPGGKLGKPARLTYYGWVTAQHQVEFEFHDLPLP
ncbi:MAG TPA: HEAT repeat domain-containing protein [Gemmataceae bacterium]|jgi:hypothetical protein